MTRRRVFRRINKRLHGCKQWGKNCLLVPFAISLHCSGWWWGWIKSQLRWNFAKVFNNDLPGSQVILTSILSSDLWLIEFQLGNWCNTDLGIFTGNFVTISMFAWHSLMCDILSRMKDLTNISNKNQSASGLWWPPSLRMNQSRAENLAPWDLEPGPSQSENWQIWNGLVDKFTTVWVLRETW